MIIFHNFHNALTRYLLCHSVSSCILAFSKCYLVSFCQELYSGLQGQYIIPYRAQYLVRSMSLCQALDGQDIRWEQTRLGVKDITIIVTPSLCAR